MAPKEVWILPELWREIIKPCLFHNIKTQGKHLKNDKYIRNYNSDQYQTYLRELEKLYSKYR